MKKITDVIQKPSQALRAMVDGLLKADKTRGLKIDMSTFGEVKFGTCFGCAATYCVMEVTGIKPTPALLELNDEEKFQSINFQPHNTVKFECAIDNARSGSSFDLFDFFGVSDRWLTNDDDRYYLRTYDWKDEIPKVEAHILELQQRGL